MKNLFILPLAALALFSACRQAPSDRYTISGTTDLSDGETVYLAYRVSSDSTVVDSATVANGAFTFSGSIVNPRYAHIYRDMYGRRLRTFVLEPAQMTIELNGDDYSDAKVTGSRFTADDDSLNAMRQPVFDRMNALNSTRAEIAGDSAAMADFIAQFQALQLELRKVGTDFMASHPDSYVSVYLLQTAMPDMELDSIKAAFARLSPEMQAADNVIPDYIAAREAIKPGSPAPEIDANDINGQPFSMESLKGKTVLLDFWATWCGPCRASLPHVKTLYDKYHGKGLEVLAVSLDRGENEWKEFVNAQTDLGMTKYVNVWDKDGKNSDKYAVQFIPCKFVIDPDGNIVGQFGDEELDQYLAGLYGE